MYSFAYFYKWNQNKVVVRKPFLLQKLPRSLRVQNIKANNVISEHIYIRIDEDTKLHNFSQLLPLFFVVNIVYCYAALEIFAR